MATRASREHRSRRSRESNRSPDEGYKSKQGDVQSWEEDPGVLETNASLRAAGDALERFQKAANDGRSRSNASLSSVDSIVGQSWNMLPAVLGGEISITSVSAQRVIAHTSPGQTGKRVSDIQTLMEASLNPEWSLSDCHVGST